MFIAALCPTFRHPQLLANSLAMWRMQDFPGSDRMLLILDDGGTFNSFGPAGNWRWGNDQWQYTGGYQIHAASNRFPSLPAKYNRLLELAPKQTDAFIVWEDDDIYLPGYISAHARALEHAELSKPDTVVLSDYPGHVVPEGGHGRFHSSLAFRRELIERIGGWPETKRADFDQQLISRLYREANSKAEPWTTAEDCQYVMGWHTGAAHGQNTMRGPDDETWYDRNEQSYAPVPFVGQLVPKLDERTKRILAARSVPV